MVCFIEARLKGLTNNYINEDLHMELFRVL